MINKNSIDRSRLKLIKAGNFEEFLYERDSVLLEDRDEALSAKEEKEVQARIKIQKAILWININRGFFGQLLSNINIYGSSRLNPPTMATNGFNITYHPDFVLGQTAGAIRFVLCHEILHCVGEHMARRGNRHPLIWNYAADYAINPILNAETDSNFTWPLNSDGSRMGLYEAEYEGMRAEDIYDLVMADQQKKAKLQSLSEESDFGQVMDSSEDMPEPDSDASVAQEVIQDPDSDDEGKKTPILPREDGEDAGDKADDDAEGEGKGKPGEDSEGDGEKAGEDDGMNIVGKEVRVTEGPNKGQVGIVKEVLPNGDIIIE